jgi:hypothetical protein
MVCSSCHAWLTTFMITGRKTCLAMVLQKTYPLKPRLGPPGTDGVPRPGWPSSLGQHACAWAQGAGGAPGLGTGGSRGGHTRPAHAAAHHPASTAHVAREPGGGLPRPPWGASDALGQRRGPGSRPLGRAGHRAPSGRGAVAARRGGSRWPCSAALELGPWGGPARASDTRPARPTSWHAARACSHADAARGAFALVSAAPPQGRRLACRDAGGRPGPCARATPRGRAPGGAAVAHGGGGDQGGRHRARSRVLLPRGPGGLASEGAKRWPHGSTSPRDGSARAPLAGPLLRPGVADLVRAQAGACGACGALERPGGPRSMAGPLLGPPSRPTATVRVALAGARRPRAGTGGRWCRTSSQGSPRP